MRFSRIIIGLSLAALVTSACSDATTQSSSKSQTSVASVVQSTSSPRNGETSFNIYLTGYSYWDNTPPGSAEISKPVIHRKAGGKGTYSDPITIAVGHVIIGNRQTLDYKASTRFYIPNLRKYVIVEDVCGDGRRPQDGPCHTGRNGLPWLDIYVDGRRSRSGDATQCARRITSVQKIIINPARDYPVVSGPLTENGCQIFSG
jgi:hypothetical protein